MENNYRKIKEIKIIMPLDIYEFFGFGRTVYSSVFKMCDTRRQCPIRPPPHKAACAPEEVHENHSLNFLPMRCATLWLASSVCPLSRTTMM